MEWDSVTATGSSAVMGCIPAAAPVHVTSDIGVTHTATMRNVDPMGNDYLLERPLSMYSKVAVDIFLPDLTMAMSMQHSGH